MWSLLRSLWLWWLWLSAELAVPRRLRNQHKSHDLLRVGLNDFIFKKNWKLFKPTLNKSCDLCWFCSLLELPAQCSTTTTTTTTTTQRPHQQQQWLTVINGKPPREVFFLTFFMLCLFFCFSYKYYLEHLNEDDNNCGDRRSSSSSGLRCDTSWAAGMFSFYFIL